jgi:integrase
MAVVLLKGRNGKHRRHWYGEYVDEGKRRIFNLNVLVRGQPPASLRDVGDDAFERSRADAEKALSGFLDEHRHKGRADHLTERLIESKTGRAIEYARVNELAQRWRNLGRETAASEAYLRGCDAVFSRFSVFMKTRNPSAAFLYEVTASDTASYMTELQSKLARKSVRDNVKLLNKAFERFLPVGAGNPFAGLVGRRAAGESETIHRKPFTDTELTALLDTARGDTFIYPLIVTAACSGMRRGDVCRLEWSSVDLDGGMLTVKTSKTGAEVEIPIFNPLREVLDAQKGVHKKKVFPEADAMLRDNPDGLTWRFKKVVAKAFGESDSESAANQIPASDILSEAESAVRAQIGKGPRRDRVLNVLKRYCGGESMRSIVESTGHAKSTVSMDLHTVQEMIGKPFLRVQEPSVKKAVRSVTQSKRAKGQRAASIRDWHALRATFVTLALTAGVPVELVRRVTGHATVEVVLKHYFRPDREQFRSALSGAMPKILIGEAGKKTPATELAELTAKLAAGNASAADKKRIKALAAKL